MATPTPVFPGAIATNAQLKVANNLVQTTLRVAVDGTNTILFVASTAGFAANMLVSIDKEIIAIDSVTASPNPALVVASGGRGFDGTSAAAHAVGAKVSVLIDAWHHNVLAAEVRAIEQALGPNLTNVPQSGWYNTAQYNFAPIVSGSGVSAPGGTLSPGNNVLTFAVVPVGVNGSDVKHYLYVSGGTGTPEACLITGGTGTAGQANGQIIVNCANSHSGAWSVRTATSGFQEAKVAAGPNSVIFIPGGSWPFYAPAYIDTTLQVIGAGLNSSVITLQSQTQDGFDVVTPNPASGQIPVIFRDFEITSSSTQTAGSMISITGAAGFMNDQSEVRNVWFEKPFIGITLTNCDYFTIVDCKFHGSPVGSTYIQASNPLNPDAGDSIIQRNWFFGGGTGINCLSGGGLRILDNKFLSSQTGVNLNWTTGGSNQLSISRNNFDGMVVNGVSLSTAPGTLLSDFSISDNYFGGAITDSLIKISQGSGTISRGVIGQNYFIQPSGTGTCINILGGSGISITGNVIVSANNASATVFFAAAGTTGIFEGNDIGSFSNGGYNVASSGFYFANNGGIDDAPRDINSGSTLTLPIQPNFVIQGGIATVVTVVPPTVSRGFRGTFITLAAQTFTAGATIGQAGVTTASKLYQWLWDGSKLWVTGPGF